MEKKTVIAVIGAAGFVGQQICAAVIENPKFELVKVLRGDSLEAILPQADIVIHSANPARRFQAERDPWKDFMETVEKTARLLMVARKKKVVLVSSLSCRTQLDTAYGRHRRACELMALGQGAMVVRLGAMYGGGRVHDSLHDILAGRRIYVAPETRYAYVDVAWAGRKILTLLDKADSLIEIGAANSISLDEIRQHFNSQSVFSGPDDTQIPESADGGPDARLVLKYCRSELSREEVP